MTLQSVIDYSLNPKYSSREERNLFTASFLQTFSDQKTVLNVGSGGEGFLKKYAPKLTITDVDMTGNVDHLVNLEKEMPFPFEKNAYDMSVCLDVLEHVDNFHELFEEILRVTKNYVVISLPNPLPEYVNNIVRKSAYTTDKAQREQFGSMSKFYGIPLSKPLDRHKWFFSFQEAFDFFALNADKYGYQVEKVFFPRRDSLVKNIIKSVHIDLYINMVPRAFWIVLKKN